MGYKLPVIEKRKCRKGRRGIDGEGKRPLQKANTSAQNKDPLYPLSEIPYNSYTLGQRGIPFSF